MLGGGVATGNAWLIGVLAGLRDGCFRRHENADLARDMKRVLVLSPVAGRSRHPLPWDMELSAQVEELRAAGAQSR